MGTERQTGVACLLVGPNSNILFDYHVVYLQEAM